MIDLTIERWTTKARWPVSKALSDYTTDELSRLITIEIGRRNHIAEGQRRRWADPEARRRHSETMKRAMRQYYARRKAEREAAAAETAES